MQRQQSEQKEIEDTVVEPIKEHCEDDDFKKFLESNLDYLQLPINKSFTASEQLLKAYEYYDGI